MNQQMKDQMARAILKTIERVKGRGGPIDPIDLTERVVDAVELIYDMNAEDAGIASLPEDLRGGIPGEGDTGQGRQREYDVQSGRWDPPRANKREDSPWDIKANAPAPPPPDPIDDKTSHFMSPPPPKQAITPVAQQPASVILMPGDKGFNDIKPEDVTARPGKIRASMKKPIAARPSRGAPQKQYWDEAELMQTIIKNTPDKIEFDIPRADGAMFHIVAKKNVVNKQGLGGVVLTYKDERFGDGGTVVMMSQVPFSLYDEHIDIDAAMESTAKQLAGLYRDRSGGNPDPVTYGPPPNLGAYMQNGMPGGSVRIDIDRDDSGRAVVIDNPIGADRGSDRVLQNILGNLKRGNTGLVPPESPLKVR